MEYIFTGTSDATRANNVTRRADPAPSSSQPNHSARIPQCGDLTINLKEITLLVAGAADQDPSRRRLAPASAVGAASHDGMDIGMASVGSLPFH